MKHISSLAVVALFASSASYAVVGCSSSSDNSLFNAPASSAGGQGGTNGAAGDGSTGTACAQLLACCATMPGSAAEQACAMTASTIAAGMNADASCAALLMTYVSNGSCTGTITGPGGNSGVGGGSPQGQGGATSQGQGGTLGPGAGGSPQGQGGSVTPAGQGGTASQGQGGDPFGQGGSTSQGQGGTSSQGQGGTSSQGQGGSVTPIGQGGTSSQGQGGSPQGQGGAPEGQGGTASPVGQGGNGGTNPNGGAPTTCEQTHGYPGCCAADGSSIYYWDQTMQMVVAAACTAPMVCAWDPSQNFYNCLSAKAADPSGTYPYACFGADVPGACDGMVSTGGSSGSGSGTGGSGGTCDPSNCPTPDPINEPACCTGNQCGVMALGMCIAGFGMGGSGG